MSVKGTDPKPKHFARTSWGSPPGVPEELEQAKNSPKHFQTAERGSEQPKASSEQPKALPKCQNGAPKGSGPGFGSKRVSKLSQKVISIGSCKAPNCQTLWLPKAPGQPSNPKHLQSAKMWLQRAPGQDLAQNGCFPMVPEGHSIGSCKEPKCQTLRLHKAPGQDWLHKAPGQDLAADGCFALIPTSNFNR